MTTQIIEAKKGNITQEMEYVAKQEDIDINELREKIALGRVVILKNNQRKNVIPTAVGEGLTVKINANIGTSFERSSTAEEIQKVKVIEASGAHVLMDLSTGHNIDETRLAILNETKLPLGTVPMYQAGKEAIDEYKDIGKLSKEKLFSDIEKHCKSGVDFITVHCGVTKFVVDVLEKQGRVTDIVSRGGSMLACWIKATGKENPLYEYYDDLLDIARTYDVTLSLGDGLRPGCGYDAGDRAQVAETLVFKPELSGVLLFLTGFLLLFSEWFSKRAAVKKSEVDLKSSIFIGLAQGLAALPGFSRSGWTIATGLFSGLDRTTAARYSFLLSIPIILGASMVYPLVHIDVHEALAYNWHAIIAGTLVSGIVGYLCIKYFMKFVSKFSLAIFGYYCIIAGLFAAVFFSIY